MDLEGLVAHFITPCKAICYGKNFHYLFYIGNQHQIEWVYNHNPQYHKDKTQKIPCNSIIWRTVVGLKMWYVLSIYNTISIGKLPFFIGAVHQI